MPKQTQFKPKQTQFQSQYMLLRMKINTRHNSSKYRYETIDDKTNSMNNVYLRPIEAYNGIEVATWLFEPSLLQERL